MVRYQGSCKWFSSSKGYGFITSSSNEDVFVHHSAIAGLGFKTLGEGEAVEFDIQADETGRRKAINVTGPNGQPIVGDSRVPRRGEEFDIYDRAPNYGSNYGSNRGRQGRQRPYHNVNQPDRGYNRYHNNDENGVYERGY